MVQKILHFLQTKFFEFICLFQKDIFTLKCKVLFKKTIMITQNKRLTGILLTVAFILLIPLIAMQFTDEVNWTLLDFVVMGILLLGTGLISELVLRNIKKFEHRFFFIAGILVALFLIWAELAVGIFGSPFAGS